MSLIPFYRFPFHPAGGDTVQHLLTQEQATDERLSVAHKLYSLIVLNQTILSLE